MALERQVTLKTHLNEPIDGRINSFLFTHTVDPASIQIVIDENGGFKRAHLIYANRFDLKKAYEAQGRTYSESDAVTYVYAKDIMVNRGGDIDEEINNFVKNEDVSILSISNYVTPMHEGAVIFYIDIPAQKKNFEAKQEEVRKMQEEMAQKLASEAVKNVNLETNDTVEKYAEKSDEILDSQSENVSNENMRTAGLMQVEGEVNEPEYVETTTTSEQEASVNASKKKKRLGRK